MIAWFLSPVDAVIADVMGAGRYMKSLLILYAASAAFGVTIQSYGTSESGGGTG